MELRTCSKARPAANMAKVLAKGIRPQVEAPAAATIMLASAMPQSKNRSGQAFLKVPVLVAPARSASKTITLSFIAASLARASP